MNTRLQLSFLLTKGVSNTDSEKVDITGAVITDGLNVGQ